MSSTRAIRKVELDAGKRVEMAYFAIECAQNVRFVLKARGARITPRAAV